MRHPWTIVVIFLFFCGCRPTGHGGVALDAVAAHRKPSAPDGHLMGVDVSHFNNDIHWGDVARDERLGFVFVKATQGVDWVDPKFRFNFEGARNQGLVTGAYHFFMTNDPGLEQARNFIKNVRLKKGDLPPVVDIETMHQDSLPDVQHQLSIFLDEVEKHFGVKPIIYTGPNFWEKHFDGSFGHYPLWVAEYAVDQPRLPKGWREWSFWQWAEKYHEQGIPTPADSNFFRGDEGALKALLLQSDPVINE